MSLHALLLAAAAASDTDVRAVAGIGAITGAGVSGVVAEIGGFFRVNAFGAGVVHSWNVIDEPRRPTHRSTMVALGASLRASCSSDLTARRARSA